MSELMSGLAAFLNARLDDDEHYLRVVTEVGQRKADAALPQDMADAYGLAVSVLSDPAMQKIIEQWVGGTVLPPNDIPRVLREVEAKRAILARYERAAVIPESVVAFVHGQDDGYRQACFDAVCELAAVYAGHPDYRQEWKP